MFHQQLAQKGAVTAFLVFTVTAHGKIGGVPQRREQFQVVPRGR